MPKREAEHREQRFRATVEPEEAGHRLDRLLAASLPQLSRTRLKSLIESGFVGDAEATITEPSYRVKPGQVLTVRVPAPEPAKPEAESIPLDVVYEDDQVIVIDKPVGMVVHPAAGNARHTLVNALLAHCGDQLSGIGGVRRPGIVHRLDKDTSGLIVVAKTDAAHAALAREFAERTMERAYRALVWGVPLPAAGAIEGNIGRSPVNRKKMAVVKRGGKPAVTRYRVLKRYSGVASLIECRLETGRTHQIRVHLANIGHSVVGDPLYGRQRPKHLGKLPDEVRRSLEKVKVQALHAYFIGFYHPITKQRLRFEATTPSQIRQLTECLERM